MNILQKIFRDYYEVIQYTLHPRAVEMENIEKMIDCGDPSFGGAMYACSQCGKMKFVWNGTRISTASSQRAASLTRDSGGL